MRALFLLTVLACACGAPKYTDPKPVPITAADIGVYAYLWVVNQTDEPHVIAVVAPALHMERPLGIVPPHDSVHYRLPMVDTRLNVFMDGILGQTFTPKVIGEYRTVIVVQP